jgi:acyl carrier protein
MEELIAELKRNIVEGLALEGISPEEIDTDAPLFVEGLGLDSIDAVELVVILEKRYGILLTEMGTAKAAFASVRTLARFIQDHRKASPGTGTVVPQPA